MKPQESHEVPIDEKAAARELGLAVKTLQNLRWRRMGPPYLKIGKRVAYLPSDLRVYLESCRIVPEN